MRLLSLVRNIPRADVLKTLYRLTMASQFRPVVMSGPSGSGKSTLLKRLIKDYQGCFAFSVSHTTRQPRPGESEGVDYHFCTRDEMTKEIEENAFIEYAEFSGNMYGTSKKAVEDVTQTGKICILDVDLQGVKSIKETDLRARYVFIKTRNLKILEERLRGRGTESEESLQKRLATASEALKYAEEKDVYDLIVVNDEEDVAYEQLRGFLAEDLEQIRNEKFKR